MTLCKQHGDGCKQGLIAPPHTHTHWIEGKTVCVSTVKSALIHFTFNFPIIPPQATYSLLHMTGNETHTHTHTVRKREGNTKEMSKMRGVRAWGGWDRLEKRKEEDEKLRHRDKDWKLKWVSLRFSFASSFSSLSPPWSLFELNPTMKVIILSNPLPPLTPPVSGEERLGNCFLTA